MLSMIVIARDLLMKVFKHGPAHMDVLARYIRPESCGLVEMRPLQFHTKGNWW